MTGCCRLQMVPTTVQELRGSSGGPNMIYLYMFGKTHVFDRTFVCASQAGIAVNFLYLRYLEWLLFPQTIIEYLAISLYRNVSPDQQKLHRKHPQIMACEIHSGLITAHL